MGLKREPLASSRPAQGLPPVVFFGS